MATRNISTRLAVEGESQYRAAIQSINSELKVLQSALKLTESQYQTNANSMNALQAKGQALNNLYQAQRSKVQELRNALENARAAEQKYAQQKAELQKKIEDNNKALEQLRFTAGDTSKEEARLTEENAKLQKELEQVDAKLSAAEKGTNAWQLQLNNAEIQLNNLDAEIQKNDKYLDEAAHSADGCAKSIDEFGREVDETADSVKGLGTILASQELNEFAGKVKDALVECAQASIEFEAGMAGVKRTTGIVGPELDEMGDYFKQLSTEIPITTQELTTIATTAGQLGVKGKDNVQQFTEVMAKLATTTDLTAETAATMLAQFANITHVTDYERLGSVVASLGDATATTATKVVEMSQGIAAAGTQAGMRERDIMAISAAVGSLGIESAAGGTAMSTLISTINKATQQGGDKLKSFASVAGMSAGEFKKYWQDDAVSALNAFITGLNDTERNGRSAMLILDELGITNVRQTRAILGLAEAGDLLTGTIAQANQAWEENTALNEKAGIMFDTAKAKMQTLENASTNLKIAIGDALAPAIVGLAEGGQKAIEAITRFVQEHPNLTAALTAIASGIVGVTTAIAGVKAAIKVLDFLGMTKGLTALKAAAAAAGGGISGLVTALGAIALPAAAAATALAGVVAVIDEWRTLENIGYLGEGHSIEEYAKNVDNLTEALEKAKAEYEALAECGGDLTIAQNAVDHATIALANATEEYEAAQAKATEATEEAADAADDLASADAAAEGAAEDLTMALDEIAQAYKSAYDAARSSLDGQIGLFDTFTAEISKDTDTASEMLQKWQEQTANLAKYNENLAKAAQYGLDDGLVKSLADGSTASAGYLATIISEIENCEKGTGTLGKSAEEAVSEFNAAFEQTEQAKDNLATTMAAISTDLGQQLADLEQQAADVNFDGFWDAVDNAFSNVDIDFSAIGTNISNALSSGIDSAAGNVGASAEAVAAAASEQFNRIPEQAQQAMSAAQQAINSAKGPMRQSADGVGSDAVKGFESGIRGMEDAARKAVSNAVTAVNSQKQGAYDAGYGVGSSIADGAAAGVRSAASRVAAEARQMVSNAIAEAKAAAASSSPSKKMIKLGRDIDEGLIIGIRDLEKNVAEQMQRTVSKTLAVEVKLPEVVDNTESIVAAMTKGTGSKRENGVIEAINGLKDEIRNARVVQVTQNVIAEETSYAGQQREAKRNFRQLAREMSI